MITFPLFSELEKNRDQANEFFHRKIKPQLIERLKHFGFSQAGAGENQLQLAEQATGNLYCLSIHPYEIRVQFEHIKTGERQLICEISNFALSAHDMLDIIISCVDCWLQYGVIYDYVAAQKIEQSASKAPMLT